MSKHFSEPYWKLLGVGLVLSVALLAVIFWRSEYIIQGNFSPPPPLPTDTAFLQMVSNYREPVDDRTIYYVVPKIGDGGPFIGNYANNAPPTDAQVVKPILVMATGSRVLAFTPSFDGKTFIISIVTPPTLTSVNTSSKEAIDMSDYENTIVEYDVINNTVHPLFSTTNLAADQKFLVPNEFSPDNQYVDFTSAACPFCAKQPSGTYAYSLKNHELYNLGLKWLLIWSAKKSGAYSYKEVIKIPCVDNSSGTDYCIKDPDSLPWKHGKIDD